MFIVKKKKFRFFVLSFRDRKKKTSACFLSGYEVGKSFMYHYETSFEIEKTVEHGNGQGESGVLCSRFWFVVMQPKFSALFFKKK
jgi:hypothetical protein